MVQECDLFGPKVVIGRGDDCHFTIDDPHISRRHIELRLDGTRPVLVDLSSRNGVRVNGSEVPTPYALKHKDRIQLGSQEMVFIVAEQSVVGERRTGNMLVCNDCGHAFSHRHANCTQCGADAVSKKRPSGNGLNVWRSQLLLEFVDRNMRKMPEDPRQAMERAAAAVDERLSSGDIDPQVLGAVTTLALRVAEKTQSCEWVSWAIDAYERAQVAPEETWLKRLQECDQGRDGLLRWYDESLARSTVIDRRNPLLNALEPMLADVV